MFEVRNISPSDIGNLLELIEKDDVKLNNIYKYLDNFLICKWKGYICGFGFGLIQSDSFFVIGIYVTPNYRSRGIGSLIMKAFINKFTVQNINKLYISGEDTAFYKSLQFEPISTQHFIENRSVFFNIYDQTISSNIYFVNTKEYVFNRGCQ